MEEQTFLIGRFYAQSPEPLMMDDAQELAPSVPAAVEFVPTVERILYGRGVVQAHLAREVQRLGVQRVLLVTTRSLAQSSLATQVKAQLAGRLAGDQAASMEHVPPDAALQVAMCARDCNADLVVALGGGSVIDSVKAARACLSAGLSSPGELEGFMTERRTLVAAIPQVSIPTTLSGSEYTRSFSVINFSEGIKHSYTSSAVASRVIFYDPLATLLTPEKLWLSSGVMAVDHAVEAFCASPAHLVGDVLKVAALKDLLTYLPQTRPGPGDLEARLRCQVAAWQADHSPLRAQSLALPAMPLYSHALAYELASLHRIAYGLIACTTLVPVLRWCAAQKPLSLARQAELARALWPEAKGESQQVVAKQLADRLEELIVGLGLPTHLRDVGVAKTDLVPLARQFLARGPFPAGSSVAAEEQVLKLLEMAW